MTYVLISLPFLLLGVIAFALRMGIVRRFPRSTRYLTVSMVVGAILLLLTIIFDNFMVWAGLVGYADSENLGISIGLIPIEDLFYSVFVALIVPALWLPITEHQQNREGQS